MSQLEGLTSALGDTWTELKGFESTRLAVAASGEEVVLRGSGVGAGATSVDGQTITFPINTLTAAVLGGGVQRFRLLGGPLLLGAVTGTCSSLDGIRVRPGAGGPLTFSGIVPGDVFRITSGGLAGLEARVRLVGLLGGDIELFPSDLSREGGGFGGVGWEDEDFETYTDLCSRELLIDSVTLGVDSILISGVGFELAFADRDWEIVTLADSLLVVENAYEWPAQLADGGVGPEVEPGAVRTLGLVAAGADVGSGRTALQTTLERAATPNVSGSAGLVVGGVGYLYDSADEATGELVGIRQQAHHGFRGRIEVVDGATLADGALIRLDDGFGTRVTLEFDSINQASIAHLRVAFEVSSTLVEVRDAALAMLDRARVNYGLLFVAWAGTDDAVIELMHLVPGGAGHLHVVTNGLGSSAGLLVDGARGLEHGVSLPVLQEVVEASETRSAFDQHLRGWQSRYARGDDLDVIDQNYNCRSPSELTDLQQRRFIQATAYSAKGLVWALERELTALLGEGAFELFESLGRGSVRDNNLIYVRRTDLDPEDSEGKWFVEGAEHAELTNSTSFPLVEAPLVLGGKDALGEVRAAGAPHCLEPESGLGVARDFGVWEEAGGGSGVGRVVAFGVSASSTDGITVSVAPDMPAALPGDILVFGGFMAGQKATVASVSGSDVDVLPATPFFVEGAPDLQLADDWDGLGGPGDGGSGVIEFSGMPWKLVRPSTNARYYLPSADVTLESVGGVGVAQWAFSGTGVEAAHTTLNTGPRRTTMSVAAPGEFAKYTHQSRVAHDAWGVFSITCAFTTLSGVDGDEDQVGFRLSDGVRTIAVGVLNEGGPLLSVGFIDVDPGLVGIRYIGFPRAILDNEYHTFEIRRNGDCGYGAGAGAHLSGSESRPGESEEVVELWLDGILIDSVLVSLFYTNAGVGFGWEFGIFRAVLAGTQVRVKDISVAYGANYDLAATYAVDGVTAAPRKITSASNPFLAGDAVEPKRALWIGSAPQVNLSGGTLFGEWEIETVVGAGDVNIIGRRRFGGATKAGQPRWFFAEHGEGFVWPDVLGHSLEILSGPNAGTYLISKVLDGQTLADVAGTHPTWVAGDVSQRVRSHVVELASDLPYPAELAPCAWRIVPAVTLAAGSVGFVIGGTATFAAGVVTFRQAAPAWAGAGDPVTAAYSVVASAHVEGGEAGAGAVETFSFEGEVDEGEGGVGESGGYVVLAAGSGASSIDGLTVVFAGGTFGGKVVSGMWLRLYDPLGALEVDGQKRQVKTVIGDSVELVEGFGIGFTSLPWSFEIGAENTRDDVSGTVRLTPTYLWDAFGIVRNALDLNRPYSNFIDFDSLERDAAGLHILRE